MTATRLLATAGLIVKEADVELADAAVALIASSSISDMNADKAKADYSFDVYSQRNDNSSVDIESFYSNGKIFQRREAPVEPGDYLGLVQFTRAYAIMFRTANRLLF